MFRGEYHLPDDDSKRDALIAAYEMESNTLEFVVQPKKEDPNLPGI